MGTPTFAVPALQALAKKHEVVLTVTQPDRPQGRGQKVAFSPVKEAALALSIPLLQPEKVRTAEVVTVIAAVRPEAIIVVAFGQILPADILSIPALGCINLHASLLPKYRGAAPIHWSIFSGDTKSGNTTMLMDKGMDTGAILLSNEVAVGGDTTTGQLHDALSQTGAQLLLDTLHGLENGSIKPAPQNESAATYAPKLTKEMELIDWSLTSWEIHNKIRGMNPWPVAYTVTKAGRLKILRSRLAPGKEALTPLGHVSGLSGEGFYMATGDGCLEILEVQQESRKRMLANVFAQGMDIEELFCMEKPQ